MPYCYNCFCELQTPGPCPLCGYDPAFDEGKFPHALPHGSILAGQYVIGRVLGQGGFGFDYLAFDRTLAVRVVIREYLPQPLCSREPGTSGVRVNGCVGSAEDFRLGRERFLAAARSSARFLDHPSIAAARSFLEENGTAYVVTEYAEGCRLSDHLKSRGGRLPWQEAAGILLPVMDALCDAARAGSPHGSVEPDNIFLTSAGIVRLIDWGETDYSYIGCGGEEDPPVFGSCTPLEQYSFRSPLPCSVDVYAVAAVFYICVTGSQPPKAIDRGEEDDLVPPSARGVRMPFALEEAILRGLEVRAEDRFPTMEEFLAAVRAAVAPPSPQPGPQAQTGPQPGQPFQSGPQAQTGPWQNQPPQTGPQTQTGPWTGQPFQSGPQTQAGPWTGQPFQTGPQTQAGPQPGPQAGAWKQPVPRKSLLRRYWERMSKPDPVGYAMGLGTAAVALALLAGLLSLFLPSAQEDALPVSSAGIHSVAGETGGESAAAEKRLTDEGFVDFQDPVLGAMLRTVLGKEEGEGVLPEELASITAFSAGAILDDAPTLTAAFADGTTFEGDWTQTERIQEAADFVWLTGCTELSLVRTEIRDIAPLAELTQLTDLELEFCLIEDLTPLAGLTGLTSLSLWENQVADLTPLAGLTQLTFLDLDGNQISDLTPLAGMTNLKALWAGDNLIADLSPLAGLVRLDSLYLTGNQLTDLSPLANLPKLETLLITDNEIEDLTPVSHVDFVDIRS